MTEPARQLKQLTLCFGKPPSAATPATKRPRSSDELAPPSAATGGTSRTHSVAAPKSSEINQPEAARQSSEVNQPAAARLKKPAKAAGRKAKARAATSAVLTTETAAQGQAEAAGSGDGAAAAESVLLEQERAEVPAQVQEDAVIPSAPPHELAAEPEAEPAKPAADAPAGELDADPASGQGFVKDPARLAELGAASTAGEGATAAATEQEAEPSEPAELVTEAAVEAQSEVEAEADASVEAEDASTATTAADTPQVSCSNSAGLSEYELERLRNIAENQKALAALGLAGPILPPKHKPPPRQRKRAAPAAAPPRSSRALRSRSKPDPAAGSAAVSTAEAAAPDESSEDEGPAFDYSNVVRYLCTSGDDAEAGGGVGGGGGEATSRRLAGWRRTESELLCPKELSKVYSFASRPASQGPPLLAAAGHAGWTAIWPLASFGSSERPAELAPLLTFQAHNIYIHVFLWRSYTNTNNVFRLVHPVYVHI